MNRRTDDLYVPWTPSRWLVLSMTVFWALLAYGIAHAATNLPQTCTTAAVITSNSCGAAKVFASPVASTPVTVQVGTAYRWTLLGDVPDSAKLFVCPADIASGAATCPVAPVAIDKCSVAGVACAPPQEVSGSFPLSWKAPTKNTDGSALTDLAGYRLYSGAADGVLTLLREIKITDASPTRVQMSGYGNGVYDFAVTAFTENARESAKSNTKTVTVSITSEPASPEWK